MIMKLNDVLTKQNVLTKLVLEANGKELSKSLKVKVMRIRRSYNKIRKEFNDDQQEFVKELQTDELISLANKVDKTPEEETRFNELSEKVNSDYREYVAQKGFEDVGDIDDAFTEDEYADILDINSGNEVEINEQKVSGVDLMEVFYELFVK